MSDAVRVAVTTFVNPHVIWIIETEKHGSTEAYERIFGGPHHEKATQVGVDKVVFVEDGRVWKRAVVKQIQSQGYNCWLLDYGVCRWYRHVYECPESFHMYQPLAYQVSLPNVVGVRRNFHAIEFTDAAVKFAAEQIKNAKSVLFRKVQSLDDVEVGVLMLEDSHGSVQDLDKVMVEAKLIAVNETLFKEALHENTKAHNASFGTEIGFDSGIKKETIKSDLEIQRGLEPAVETKTVKRDKDTQQDVIPQKPAKPEVSEHVITWIQEASKITHSKTDNCQSRLNDSLDQNKDTLDSKTSTNKSTTEQNKIDDPFDYIQRIGANSRAAASTSNASTNSANLLEHEQESLSHSKSDSSTKKAEPTTPANNAHDKDNEVRATESTPKIGQSVQDPYNWPYADSSGQSVVHLNLVPAGMQPKPAQVFTKRSPRGQFERTRKENADAKTNPKPSQNSDDNSSQKSNSGRRSACSPGPTVDRNATRVCSIVAPCCKCQDCRPWNSKDVLYKEPHGYSGIQTEKCDKSTEKPGLLLKESDEFEKSVDVERYQFSDNPLKTQRDIAPVVLVHGRMFGAPCKSIEEAPFHELVHKALKGFLVYTVQSFGWPAITRNRNICLVNSARSGKTYAYMPVLCSNLISDTVKYGVLPQRTVSPIVLVVCPGVAVAENVHKMALNVLQYVREDKMPSVVLATPPLNAACLNQFKGQIDILITTPAIVMSLVASMLITMKRLSHLVIEEADEVLAKHSKHAEQLLHLVQSMLHNRLCSRSVQLIATSKSWTVPLEALMKRLCNLPLICIGNYLEAALYGRANININFLESSRKPYKLIEILENSREPHKVIVLFKTSEEIHPVQASLEASGIQVVALTESTKKNVIQDVENIWLNITVPNKHFVLLCTDGMFKMHLNICNATMLVNYSLPSLWSDFCRRFSSLIENYQSPLGAAPNEMQKYHSYIFVDETNSKQYPRLIALLQRLHTKLPAEFEKLYNDKLRSIEEEKFAAGVSLCKKIKAFGKCDEVICPRRHILSPDADVSNTLPSHGLIHFRLLTVHDVNCFTVKLLEYFDSDNKRSKWNHYDDMHGALNADLSREKVYALDPKVGGKYAVYQTQKGEGYERCVVLKVLNVEKITNRASTVRVRLIDTGEKVNIATTSMFELPDKYKKIPSQGTTIYIANISPPDGDASWSTECRSTLQTALKEVGYSDRNTFFASQILLQLGNAFWVKNLRLVEQLPTVGATVTKFVLKKYLLEQKLADSDEAQLEGLYALCKEAEIKLPDYHDLKGLRVERPVRKQVEPQWAFLDEGSEQNEVYFASAESPAEFYVRLWKFATVFADFTCDLQAAIRKPLYPQDFEIEIGGYYLAKDPKPDVSEYHRVKVIDMEGELFDCFYVDYGDYALVERCHIMYLSDEFITRLPFQVIECRLYGVRPILDCWAGEATDVLYNHSIEGTTQSFKVWRITSVAKETPTTTGGQKHAVLLFDGDVCINHSLVTTNLAEKHPEEDMNAHFNETAEDWDDDEDDKKDEDGDSWDDEEVAQKEFTFKEVAEMQKKYGVVPNDDAEDLDENSIGSDENVWDIQVNDADQAFKDLLGIKESPREISTNRELPPMRALPPSNHCIPETLWHQTPNCVKFDIHLNVSDCTIKVMDEQTFYFSAIHDEKEYKLDVHLFGKVQRHFNYTQIGSSVRITLQKQAAEEWPRLTSAKLRIRQIKYDLNYCADEEGKRKRFLELDVPDIEDEDKGAVYEFGSEDSESEDDETLPDELA